MLLLLHTCNRNGVGLRWAGRKWEGKRKKVEPSDAELGLLVRRWPVRTPQRQKWAKGVSGQGYLVLVLL